MTTPIQPSISSTPLHDLDVDLLIIPLKGLKNANDDAIKTVVDACRFHEIADEDHFQAKHGQTLLFRAIQGVKAKRILFVGLCEKGHEIRPSLVKAAREALKVKASDVALFIPEKEMTRNLCEGFHLGSYRFDKFKTQKQDEEPYNGVERLTLVGNICEHGVKVATAFASGILKARDLGNEPPNLLYPQTLADKAVEIAKTHGLKHTVYDEKYLTEHGFNLLMAVGVGCEHQPRLIHLQYQPEGEVTHTIAYVGKGITFDTGGYDLKTGGHILHMHLDMCGAAAVLGAAEIIGALKPKNIAVHFIVPAAQNSVSSNSYLPNAIYKGLGGQTVEIQNTDAEGRLVLADALAYAQQQNVNEIVDLATLTGACVVALGDYTAALYSDDEAMVDGLLNAAKENDEDLWRMPLNKKLDKQLDSKVADMRNIGERMGGSITAALFLKRWVSLDAWAHIDLAGPAMASSETDLSTPGGTGYGVALLADYVLSKSKA